MLPYLCITFIANFQIEIQKITNIFNSKAIFELYFSLNFNFNIERLKSVQLEVLLVSSISLFRVKYLEGQHEKKKDGRKLADFFDLGEPNATVSSRRKR